LKFNSSDDEGSDEEEDENENELDEDEDDDEDYHEAEEEQQQQKENEFSFGIDSNQQSNGFQFGKPEALSGLSNMMAKFDFNVSSPFNFVSQPTTTEVIHLNSLISII
jgi:hypothetical protein